MAKKDAKGKKAAADKGKTAKRPAAKGKAEKRPSAKASASKGKARSVAVGSEESGPPPRLRLQYENEVIGQLKKRFDYRNKHQIPKLRKVVLNMGVGEALGNIRFLEAAAEDLSIIAGQKPSIRRAKKSIANFKLRTGNPIGVAVTLRGARMYEFLDRMISVAIPRVRDFRGLSPKGLDGRGNYNFGIKEQIIFPEIRYDKVEKIRGLNVSIVTTAETDEEGYELLKAMRMPFRER
ncbi:MAG: 50S ribosomal protein L5 [Candidatus Eisenbacteria sp.]|nr:50S ribosomal protein L5 [Candidatus Eisenbacteria bacterium]